LEYNFKDLFKPSSKSFGQAFSKACGVWGGAPRNRHFFFAKLFSLCLLCQRKKRLNYFAKVMPLLAVGEKIIFRFCAIVFVALCEVRKINQYVSL